MYFFFFQAEDGIRDLYVTGVQTCALPIFLTLRPSPMAHSNSPPWSIRPAVGRSFCSMQTKRSSGALPSPGPAGGAPPSARRSEERRVGKECGFRWASKAYERTSFELRRVH